MLTRYDSNRPEKDLPSVPGKVSDAAEKDVPMAQSVLAKSAKARR
jgi:hypothetical protein